MVDQGVESTQVKSTTNVKRGLTLSRFSLHLPIQTRLPATARLWACLALVAWATASSGQEADRNASAVGPLQYRTIFAPADREDQWRPTGKPAYFPMEPVEFHEKVALANGLSSQPSYAGGAIIASARYEARLEGRELVDGHALLQVRQLSPQGASLSFAPCNLSILKADWADRDGETARIGLGANRQLQLRVGHDGVLELDWTLRGRVGVLGAIEFDLGLPASPATQLALTLPENTIPISPDSVVCRKGAVKDGARVWEMDLGGQSRISLRITSENDPEGHRQLTELKQAFAYNLAPGGLELTATLRFDILGQPLRQFQIVIDPELELISVRDGEKPVPWSVVNSGDAPLTRIVVEPESPLRGIGRELKLTALAPVRAGEKWRLPRVLCESLFWHGAAATLTVERPLTVEDLLPSRARISGARTSNDPLGAEIVELQYFAADAEIQVVLRQERQPPRINFGVALDLSGGQIAGRQTAVVEVAHGECFSIEDPVTRSWIIDSVQCEPAGMLKDWRVEQAAGGRRLLVELLKPVSPSCPIRLGIAARRLQSPVGRKHTVQDAIPVRFAQNENSKALIALSAAEPYQIVLAGDETLQRREPPTMTAEELRLFPETPRGLVFVHDQSDRNLSFQLQERRSRYSADIRVAASVAGGRLTESYTFRVNPGAARLERLAVELLHRPDARIRWFPTAGDQTRLVAAPGGGEGGAGSTAATPLERWEIRLRPSRSEPFEIRATRTSRLTEATRIGLARLPEAVEQTGVLTVDCAGDSPARVKNLGLTPVISDAPQLAPRTLPRATYRFDPSQDMGDGPAISIVTNDPGGPAAVTVWAWDCQLESRLQPDGSGRHVAEYRLENVGCPVLRVHLPPSTEIEQIESIVVDGQRASWQGLSSGGGRILAVRLDPRRRFQTMTISFRTVASRWSVVERLEAPLPEPEAPVLARRWVAWLPPGRQSLPLASSSGGQASPGNWTWRLLGPLAQAAGAEPLDPVGPDSWRHARRSPTDKDLAIRKGERLLQVLAQTAASQGHDPDPRLDWGKLLTHPAVKGMLGDTSEQQTKGVLLVDWEALQQRGVLPGTVVPSPPGNDLAGQAASLLQSAGLAFAVSGRGILLTTSEKAAAEGNRIERISGDELWWVDSPVRQAEIARAARTGESLQWIPAADWAGLPPPAVLPWNGSRPAGYEAKDTVGWSVSVIGLAGGNRGDLVVVDRYLLRCMFWLTFLFVAGLTWRFASARPVLGMVPAFCLALAAIYGPDFWAVWFSAGFWGGIAGLGASVVSRPRRPRVVRIVATRRPGQSGVLQKAVLGGLLVLASGAAIRAQAATAPAESTPTPLVFVPVDKQGQPTGGKYYVSEDFYSELWRRASLADQKPRGWLLNSATYRGRLGWQTASERLALTDFKAVFDIEIIGALQRVEIPLGASVDHWNLDQAKLDGRQIEPAWEEDGTLVFYAEQTDWCRLELSLRPVTNYGADPGGFELTIPPLAMSRLELSVPPDAPQISVPSALGRVTGRQEPSQVLAELGPADRLVVRWQETGRAAAGKSTQVEELHWMKVELGYALVDTRIRYQVGPDFNGEATLLRDPRLIQQGQFTVQGAALAGVESDRDGPLARQTLRLSGVEGPAVIIQGQFLLGDTSGIGRLRFPAIRSAEHTVSRRWAAVSVSPSLRFEYQTIDRVSTIGLSDFAGAWGQTASPPTLAFQMDSPESSLTLSTQPKEPKSTAEWRLAVGYGQDKTTVRFRATVDTSEGYLFQHRLAVPENLELSSLAVTANNLPRTCRWTRPSRAELVVFFDAPLSGPHTIDLEGAIVATGERSEPLPSLRVESVSGRAAAVELFRHPEVCVKVEKVEGMTEIGIPASAASDPELGRVVSRWGIDGGGPATMNVRVSENRPKVSAEQEISVWHRPHGWVATLDCRLKVSGGLLDQVRLSAPPSWHGPFELDSKFGIESIDTERGLITVKPKTPIEGEAALRISGPIQQTGGMAPSVPQVQLMDVQFERRLVLLPAGPDATVRWQTDGLVEAPVPTRFSVQSPAAGWMAYDVKRDDFVAVLRPITEPARVYLADICLDWTEEGLCHGVAVFDLRADEMDSCVLRLPDGLHPVAAANAGVPLYPEAKAGHSWEVPLGRTALPQRLEIVFAGRLPTGPNGAICRLSDFQLEQLPILRSVWTVTGPRRCQLVGISGNREISSHELAMERVRNVSALIDIAGEENAASVEESRAWYRGWLGNWAEGRHNAQRALVLASRNTSVRAELAELEALDAEQSKRAERDKASDLWSQLMNNPGTGVSAGAIWDSRAIGTKTKHFRLDGQSPSAALQADWSDTGAWRAVGIWPGAALAGIVLGSLLAMASGRLHRWPHVAGALIGLGWWLWLWPSAVGLLVVGVCLVTSLRLGWRRTQGGSVIG